MEYFGVLGSELLNIFLVKINVWNDKTIKKFNLVGRDFVISSVRFLDLDNLLNNMFFIISTIMTVIIPVLFMKSNLQIDKLVILIALLNQYYPMCEYIFQIITNIKVFENAKTRLNQLLAYEKDRRENVILKDISCNFWYYRF